MLISINRLLASVVNRAKLLPLCYRRTTSSTQAPDFRTSSSPQAIRCRPARHQTHIRTRRRQTDVHVNHVRGLSKLDTHPARLLREEQRRSRSPTQTLASPPSCRRLRTPLRPNHCGCNTSSRIIGYKTGLKYSPLKSRSVLPPLSWKMMPASECASLESAHPDFLILQSHGPLEQLSSMVPCARLHRRLDSFSKA